jgi:hypothetical protein
VELLVGGVEPNLRSVCLHKITHRFVCEPPKAELAAFRDWSKQRALGDSSLAFCNSRYWSRPSG